MRTGLLIACVFLATASSPASAGLDLTAGACNAGPGPTVFFNFDCTAVGTTQTLFGCMQLGVAQDSVVAVECELALTVADPGLPDWWHFETGGCDDGLLGMDITRNLTACPTSGATPPILDLWGTQASACPVVFTPQTHGPNTGHCFFSISRTTPINLTATGNYFVFNLNFLSDNANQSGGACQGCGIGACLAWCTTRLTNIRSGSQPYFVSGPGLLSNRVVWNSGTPECIEYYPCPPVTPTKNRTWGQLKSLYR